MNRKEFNIPAGFKYVMTRKDKACEGCGRIIHKGSRTLSVHGRVFGYWFSEYWCNDCDLDRIDSIPEENLKQKMLEERGSVRATMWCYNCQKEVTAFQQVVGSETHDFCIECKCNITLQNRLKAKIAHVLK